MNTNTINQTGYKAFAGSEKKALLTEKFRSYVTENSMVIAGGLMMLSGDGNAYHIYKMMNR